MAALISSATATNQDMVVAIDEMQKANYFTFVMLINMAPSHLIESNTTFLMPNDRILSQTDVAPTSVADFLLRHSIPSPLLIDHLQHFPTGSMIPTSKSGFFLQVTNQGRRQFFLNNVRIISPNICTQGSSIRCHGVDGVLQPTTMTPQPNVPLPPSSTTCPKPTIAPEASAPLPAPSPPLSADDLSPVPPPSDVSLPKSSSPDTRSKWGVVNLVVMVVFMLSMGKSWLLM
ncbi:hypothetical protein Salat_1080700 [Sesamum alatum]|uniref:FAS1 domain-containing protein n=1 Tax=Sesamum alatum TaxID=300844 RepID=A0AAE1YML4_9LAMI|nr:hypothetical protein Salat_1080700 [Sesamum alatum]